jgi:hypothetical protein
MAEQPAENCHEEFNTEIQWEQNNSEIGLRHSKRGTKDGKGTGEQDSKQSV